MLLHDRHPQISLAILMVREAIESGANSIRLTRGDREFSVVYTGVASVQKRDRIDNRHWHNLLAALHCLAGMSAFRDPESSSGIGATNVSDVEFNTVYIDYKHPNIDNVQLRGIREAGLLPITLQLAFTDDCVKIEIRHPASLRTSKPETTA